MDDVAIRRRSPADTMAYVARVLRENPEDWTAQKISILLDMLAQSTSDLSTRDAAYLRTVRRLHAASSEGPDDPDVCCAHCSWLHGGSISYPCQTIQAIGGEK